MEVVKALDYLCFPAISRDCWIRSGATGTRTLTPMPFWHHRKRNAMLQYKPPALSFYSFWFIYLKGRATGVGVMRVPSVGGRGCTWPKTENLEIDSRLPCGFQHSKDLGWSHRAPQWPTVRLGAWVLGCVLCATLRSAWSFVLVTPASEPPEQRHLLLWKWCASVTEGLWLSLMKQGQLWPCEGSVSSYM